MAALTAATKVVAQQANNGCMPFYPAPTGSAPRILVSACLLGQPVRYNGTAKTLHHTYLQHWQHLGLLVPFCPELAGGLPTPRPPAEIAQAHNGTAVLAGNAIVHDTTGADVTAPFVAGAHKALHTARTHGCTFALLTDGSPSCGSLSIYDGSFSGHKQAGAGVTTALLRQNGIAVFAHTEVEALAIQVTAMLHGNTTPT